MMYTKQNQENLTRYIQGFLKAAGDVARAEGNKEMVARIYRAVRCIETPSTVTDFDRYFLYPNDDE